MYCFSQFFADWKAKTELKQAEKEKAKVIIWIAAWWGVTMRSQAYYTTPNRANTGMEWNCVTCLPIYTLLFVVIKGQQNEKKLSLKKYPRADSLKNQANSFA